MQGRLKQETWEKDGKKQSKTIIMMESFEFMSRGDGKKQSAPDRNTSDVPTPKSKAAPTDDDEPPF